MAEFWLIISFLGGAILSFFAVNNFRYSSLRKEHKVDRSLYLTNHPLMIKESQKPEIADQTIVLKVSCRPPEPISQIFNKKL